ncbi:MAG: hypothetical protein HY070_09375 [Chloroflexi bacterium]|nr:hypothetical protein [Chloroflexota bacterium]MBI3741145.1 hypothetical protein [Chloroflexota bacterium]
MTDQDSKAGCSKYFGAILKLIGVLGAAVISSIIAPIVLNQLQPTPTRAAIAPTPSPFVVVITATPLPPKNPITPPPVPTAPSGCPAPTAANAYFPLANIWYGKFADGTYFIFVPPGYVRIADDVGRTYDYFYDAQTAPRERWLQIGPTRHWIWVTTSGCMYATFDYRQ